MGPEIMGNHLKRLLWLGLCMLLAPGAAAAGTVVHHLALSPDAVTVTDAGGLTRVQLKDAGAGFPPGGPALPLIARTVFLPRGETAGAVRVVVEASDRLPGVHVLAAGGAAGRFTPGPDSPNPADPLVAVGSGRMRGRPVATVLVSPVVWDADTGTLTLLKRLRVEIDTRSAPGSPGDFTVLRESAEGRRTFPGPAADGALAPVVNSGAPFAPGFLPTVDGSPVDMVIITTGDQAAEYQRLADYKTKTGVATVVRTVDWIAANYPNGVDTQETIRNFIKDAAAKWGTAWILLGGDTGPIPARHGYSHYRGGEDIPTDLYYTDLDGNWNADGDDLIGEGTSLGETGDGVDLYPDVWVGRLPSNNAAEAQVLVDKVLAYLQSPPLGYQNDALFLSEVLFPSTWSPEITASFDGPLITEAVVDTLPPRVRAARLYENYTAWPGAYPETKQAAIDSMNAGYQLVHLVGHGYINTMSVGLGGQTLTNVDAENLVNGGKTFLLYALDCTSNAIDFSSISEKFMNNPNGGAVGVVGSSEVEDPITTAGYNTSFFHLLYHGGVTELGRTLALCKTPYIPLSDSDNFHRWTQFSQIYLGDPSLPFWTDVPVPLDVVHAGSFTLGQGDFSVTVNVEGAPAESARVALYKKDDAYAVGYTDVSGMVTLPFRPDEPGTVSVGVTFPDALPYLGTVQAVPPASPYLFVRSQIIVDDGSENSMGNGDGRIDAGETVALHLVLENGGCATETGIQASISVSSPKIFALDQISAFPDIDPDSTAVASDPMTLLVQRSASDRLTVPATLTVTGGVGGPYSQEILLYVHAPIVDLWRQTVRDTVGNGNGDSTITANEDFAILPVIRNIGLGTLGNAEFRLRSSDGAVTITDSVSVLGDVASGDTGPNPADGLAARFSDVAVEHELRLVVLDDYGEAFTAFLDVIPPPVPANLSATGSAQAITVRWDAVDHDDLRGYVVYRGPSDTGPFTRVSDWISEGIAYFEDSGLPPLTQQYYRVAAVDSSGNESGLSGVVGATTTLPLHSGWPVALGTSTPGGVAVGDLDGDGGFEVVATSDEIYAVTPDGQDYLDGDMNAQTLGPILDTGKARFWNTPAVGDVDGDGFEEIASAGWDDGLLYLVDHNGQILPGWPKDVNPLGEANLNPIGSAVLGDVDADGDLEVFCLAGKVLFGWQHDGTEIIDGDADPGTDGVIAITGLNFSYCTPTVANIDADPYRELVTGARDGKLYAFRHDGTPYPGFPVLTGDKISASPAVGDLDGDGIPEIVFASSDSTLYAIRADLSVPAGFPKTVPLDEDWDPSPALGDLDGDGHPDVVIGCVDHRVYAFSGIDGSLLPGFPADLQSPEGTASTRSSPVLADVTGNGNIDIVIGDRSGWLHGFDHAGQPLAGFPLRTGNRIDAAPLVWDVDGDGLVEIVAESFDQQVYCWDAPWTFDPARAPWPMFKGNQQNTGEYGYGAVSGQQVGTGGEAPPALLPRNFPNPFTASTSILYRVPEGGGRVTLQIFDLNGRLVRTLIRGTETPGIHEARWDGTTDRGRPAASGIYLYRLTAAERAVTRKMILLRR